MKFKLGELWGIRGVQTRLQKILMEIARQENEKKIPLMPIRTGSGLLRSATKIKHEVDHFEVCRQRLLELYGKKDEKGKFIITWPTDEKGERIPDQPGTYDLTDKEAFDKAFNEAAAIETEEITYPLFAIEDFGRVELSLDDIIFLVQSGFLKGEEAEEPKEIGKTEEAEEA